MLKFCQTAPRPDWSLGSRLLGMAVSLLAPASPLPRPPARRRLIGDFTDWDKQPPIKVVGTQPITLTLPRCAWVEYAWLGEDGQPFADPDNPTKSLNPWWTYPRAVEVGHYLQSSRCGPVKRRVSTAPRTASAGTARCSRASAGATCTPRPTTIRP